MADFIVTDTTIVFELVYLSGELRPNDGYLIGLASKEMKNAIVRASRFWHDGKCEIRPLMKRYLSECERYAVTRVLHERALLTIALNGEFSGKDSIAVGLVSKASKGAIVAAEWKWTGGPFVPGTYLRAVLATREGEAEERRKLSAAAW